MTRTRELDDMRDRLLAAYAKAGHPIRSPVEIEVRRDLRATATTFRTDRGFAILVNERALDEGPAGMLLAHEMGHVQRMDSEHPSHDDAAITAAYAAVPQEAKVHEYQRRVLHNVINFTQDLYADPLAFRIGRELGIVDPRQLESVILGFANDEPYEIDDPRERRWDQTEDMVGNARAVALAKLTGAKRAHDLASAASERYLARIPRDVARESGWFRALFEGFPEETTREEFTGTLVAFARRFVATAEGS